jgi:membrane protease YdiL (CAAX protease family)
MVQASGRFSYWSQLAILLGLVGLGIIIAGLTTVLIGLKALGSSNLMDMEKATAIQAAFLKPENAGYAQAAQIAGTLFIMFLPSLAFILICHKKMLWAGFSKHFNVKQVAIGFLIILTANYFAAPFADISKNILSHFPSIDKLAKAAEDLYIQTVASMSNLKDWKQFFTAVFIIAFFPALFEEMLFRGVLQNLLTRWLNKPVLAIVIVSILFSLIHASYYLFISRFVLGYVLGLMFFYTKNIWVNIFAHFINNGLALSALFYANLKNKPALINDMDEKLPVWSLIITFAILYGLIVLLIRVSKESRNHIALKENLVFSNAPFLAAHQP